MFKSLLIVVSYLLIAGCGSIPAVQKDQSLSDYLLSTKLSGSVLVSIDNKVIHAAGYGFANNERETPNTLDTRFYIASLTKQFTALAIMQLQEKQLLNLNDPIAKYLPESPKGSDITIRHLLSHSAGLQDFTDNWDDIKHLNLSTQQIIEQFEDKPLRFKPGKKIEYSSSGYILAGKIIEKVSGMSYADYIETRIFGELGMNNSSYGYPASGLGTGNGYKKGVEQNSVNMALPYAAGSLASTVTDLFLWDQSFYNRSLIGENSLQEIFPNDRRAPGLGFGTGKFKVVMGLGWGVYDTDFGPEYSHTGNVDGFSTVISRYPNQKAMIVILSNQDSFDVFTLKNRIAKLVLSSIESAL